MSRYEIPARDPAHKVLIGWRPPLQTFFMQVIDREREQQKDDEHDPILYGRGTRPGELYEVSSLECVMRHYAQLTREVAAMLYRDKERDR